MELVFSALAMLKINSIIDAFIFINFAKNEQLKRTFSFTRNSIDQRFNTINETKP